jgi:hypothetical protein
MPFELSSITVFGSPAILTPSPREGSSIWKFAEFLKIIELFHPKVEVMVTKTSNAGLNLIENRDHVATLGH